MTSDYLAKLEAMATRASDSQPKPSSKKKPFKSSNLISIPKIDARVIINSAPRIEVHINVPRDDTTILTSERILDKPVEIPKSGISVKSAWKFPKELEKLGFSPSSYQYFLDDGDRDILDYMLDDKDTPSMYPRMESTVMSIRSDIEDAFEDSTMEKILSEFISTYLEPCLHVGLTTNNPFEFKPCVTRIPIMVVNIAQGTVYHHDLVLYAPHLMLFIICTLGKFEFNNGIKVHWGITDKHDMLTDIPESDVPNTISYSLSLRDVQMARLGAKPEDPDHDIAEVAGDFRRQLTNVILRDLQNETK